MACVVVENRYLRDDSRRKQLGHEIPKLVMMGNRSGNRITMIQRLRCADVACSSTAWVARALLRKKNRRSVAGMSGGFFEEPEGKAGGGCCSKGGKSEVLVRCLTTMRSG